MSIKTVKASNLLTVPGGGGIRGEIGTLYQDESTGRMLVWDRSAGIFKDLAVFTDANKNALYGAADVPVPVSGAGNITSMVSWTKSAAANAAILADEHADLVGTGGTIWLPGEVIQLTGGIDISAYRTGDYLNGSVTFAGRGMGVTKVVMNNASGALFAKSAGHGHGFRDLTMYGPGTGGSAVAVDWLNAAGGSLWQHVWIENFAIGAQFWNATSMQFVDVHWHGNGTNLRLGYQCDLFNFLGGRIQNAARGIHIGWRGPLSQAGGMKCSPVTIIGARFGECTETAAYLDDVEGFGADFQGCYFEHSVCDVIIGGNGTNAGPKNTRLARCDFTRPVSASDVRIKCTEPNSNASVVVEDCHSDFDATGNFVELGFQGSLSWLRNEIGVTGAGATAKIGDASISSGWKAVVPKGASWEYNRAHHIVGDGTLLGNANPLMRLGMTNGSGKDVQKWTRYSGSTGAEVGLMASVMRDVGGNFIALEGPIRPGAIALGSLPTASATYRGITVRVESASGTADGLYTCLKSAADTYSWKQIAAG